MAYERNVKGSKRGFGYNPQTRSLGIYVDGQLTASFPPTPGRTYFVNNITGASTNDGLSWETAMDEVSTAVTASETYRALGGLTGAGRSVDTNDYVRNTIIVQGTGTAYTAITALPLYCDIVGIGADPRGTNQGVPRIGSDTVAESGCVCTATVRGLNVYNIQFQAGINCWPLKVANMYRSRFENCSFMTNGAATGNPAVAFYATNLGSVVLLDCFIGGSSGSLDTEPDIGIDIAGTHFHNCLVQNCFIAGKTAGFRLASTVTSGWGSLVKDCFIGESSQTMAIGIDDNATAGHCIYAGNYIFATDAVELTHNGTNRNIGNIKANAFTT